METASTQNSDAILDKENKIGLTQIKSKFLYYLFVFS